MRYTQAETCAERRLLVARSLPQRTIPRRHGIPVPSGGRAGAHGIPCRGGIPCLTRMHGIPCCGGIPGQVKCPHRMIRPVQLHAACCTLHAAYCMLRAACCMLHAVCMLLAQCMLCRSRRGRHRLVRRVRRRALRRRGRPRALSRGRSHPPVCPIWHGYDTAAWLSHGGTVSRGMMRTQETQRLAGNVPARTRTSPVRQHCPSLALV